MIQSKKKGSNQELIQSNSTSHLQINEEKNHAYKLIKVMTRQTERGPSQTRPPNYPNRKPQQHLSLSILHFKLQTKNRKQNRRLSPTDHIARYNIHRHNAMQCNTLKNHNRSTALKRSETEYMRGRGVGGGRGGGLNYFSGTKSRQENPQKLIHLSPRSHPRHLVEKRTAQKDAIKDTTSDSQVDSHSHTGGHRLVQHLISFFIFIYNKNNEK